MKLLDQFVFNGQIFQRHRVRTFLLLLAVGIGVASVILLTSLGEGARRYVDREFSALGNRVLLFSPVARRPPAVDRRFMALYPAT